jgi:hypothetical protein
MQYVAPYPANVITSDVTGQFASVAALNATGLYLFNLINSSGGGGSSSAELALTGSILSSRINSLSGYVVLSDSGLSGFLQNQISNSGAGLNSKIDSLSGYSNATFATQSRIDLTGQALSQNLYLTGSNLFVLITGSSGYNALVYATKTNLEQTGSNLQAQIDGLQGAQFITTGTADQRYVNLTTSQLISGAKTFRTPIRVNNIVNDGLIINIDGISGAYAGYGGAGPEINLFASSLKNLIGQTTLDWGQRLLSGNWGTDGVVLNGFSIINWSQLVNTSGNISIVLTETGSILNNKINSLSGYANSTFSTITRVANTGSVLDDKINALSGANLQYISGVSGALNNLIQGSAGGVSSINGQSGILNIVGAGNISVTTGTNTITVSGNTGDYVNFATAINLDLTGSNLFNLITGFSGQANINFATITNLASTGQQALNATNNNSLNLSGNLAQTGITLLARDLATSGVVDSKINSLSGYTNTLYGNNILYTTGNQNIAGTKSFNSGDFTGRLSASGTSGNYAMIVQSFQGATGGRGLRVSAGATAGDDAVLVTNALGTVLVRIDGVGKLGIGTATPQQALDIVGNLAISGNIVAAGNITGAAGAFTTLSATTGLTLNDGTANSPNINFQTTSGTRIMDMDGSTIRILNMAASNARFQLTDAGNLTVDGSVTGQAGAFTTLGAKGLLTVVRSDSNNSVQLDSETGEGHLISINPNSATLPAFLIQGRNNVPTTQTYATFTSTGLNSTAIGATTASTGAFTTLSASGLITSTNSGRLFNRAGASTAEQYFQVANSGGDYFWGVNDSAAVFAGGTAYSLFRYVPTGRVIQDIVQGTAITTTSATGLAVTGALSSTGQFTGQTNFSIAASGTDYPSSGYNFTRTATNGAYNYTATDFASRLEFTTGGFRFLTAPSGTAGNGITFTERAVISSTGLALTGSSGLTSFTGSSTLGLRITGPTSTNDYAGIDFSASTAAPRARIASYFTGSGSYLVLGTSNNYTTGITNSALTIDFTGLVTLANGLTVTGTITGLADQAIVNQNNGNASTWYGRIVSKNSTSDRAAFLGTYGSIAGVFAHNNAMTAWTDLYINTVDGSTGGIIRMTSSVFMAGNQALHAGNYNGYAPTLTGTGASGTWGISITGSASLLSGLAVHAGRNNEANKVVRTDANGYIQAGWINTDSGDNGTTAISRVYASQDGYIRYYTPANFATAAKLVTQMDGSRDNTDYNSRLTSGFFNGADAAPNKPGQAYAQLITVRGVDTGWQMAGGYANNTIYTRGWHSSGTFYQWYTLLSDGNFNSYAPTLTGTGASGTWGINVTGTASSISGFNNPATGATANTIVYRDGSGHISGNYLFGNYVNSGDDVSGGTVSYIMAKFGDNYYRSATAAKVATFLSGQSLSVGTLTTNSTLTVNNGWSYVANNYGYGVVGLYNSTIYQLVFAMGDSYKTTAGGGINNLYGIAWSYPSAGGIAANLDSHGLIVAINGGFGSCMSYSIVASGNVTAYSDERLKTDWTNLPEDYVSRLAKVKVGTYTRLDGERLRQVGISAQSLRPLLPEAVVESQDNMKTLKVSYGNAAMASAVELAKEVVKLKEQLSSAIKRLNKLENK